MTEMSHSGPVGRMNLLPLLASFWIDIMRFQQCVCATSKGSDQPAHTRSLVRAFASRLNIP